MCNCGKPSGNDPSTPKDFVLPVEQQRALPIEPPSVPAQRSELHPVLNKLPGYAADLPPLSPAEREFLHACTDDNVPHAHIVGVDRPIDPPISLEGLTSAARKSFARGRVDVSKDNEITWTGRIRSQGATRLRVLIRDVDLPQGAKVFVADEKDQQWGPYSPSQHAFWTHSIFGDTVIVQVRIPNDPTRKTNNLVIPTVAHIEEPKEPPANPAPRDKPIDNAKDDHNSGLKAAIPGGPGVQALQQYCRPDNATSPQDMLFAKLSKGVGKMLWPTGGGRWGQCSGGLLQDGRNSRTPFFLTAHHCLSTQAAASGLEVIWHFVRKCTDQSPPPQGALPRSLGATLLATGARTDFTLLQLRQAPPADAHFIHWTRTDISTTPATLYRLSHPGGASQHLAISALVTSGGRCGRAFLHSLPQQGGTAPGSSGSVVCRAAGNEPEVVGQLYGWCPPTIDGSFSHTYPLIQQFLGSELPTEPGQGPVITFVAVPDTATTGTRISVRVRVTDPNGVASVSMFWEATNSTFTCPGSNNEDWWCARDGDLYTWTILLGDSTSARRFYVTATDSQGHSSVSQTKLIRIQRAAQGRIVFVSDQARKGRRDIYRINADGTGLKRLTTGTGNEQNYAPAWSPDGEYIVFIRDRGRNPELFIMDAEGGNARPLAKFPFTEDQPAWANGAARSEIAGRGI